MLGLSMRVSLLLLTELTHTKMEGRNVSRLAGMCDLCERSLLDSFSLLVAALGDYNFINPGKLSCSYTDLWFLSSCLSSILRVWYGVTVPFFATIQSWVDKFKLLKLANHSNVVVIVALSRVSAQEC